MKLHLDNNIVEGTPKELVEYLKLVKEEDLNKSLYIHTDLPTEQEKDTFKSLTDSIDTDYSYSGSPEGSTDEAETASTDIQVGDRVKVLKSEGGAEGEATVTKVLNHGDVELDGISEDGKYLTNWANHVSNLEKIEAEEDKLLGYRYWYLDGTNFNKFVVLEVSLGGYFKDSTGKRYTYQAVSGYVKPVDNEYVCKAFERAKDRRALLSYYPVVDAFQTSY
ncbi:hypothetical protein [Staphylococcus phage LSA2302]|nr:hypothetical protein [Staphylococcus phage LSA2302]